MVRACLVLAVPPIKRPRRLRQVLHCPGCSGGPGGLHQDPGRPSTTGTSWRRSPASLITPRVTLSGTGIMAAAEPGVAL
jgi:hypothetical protein